MQERKRLAAEKVIRIEDATDVKGERQGGAR